MRTNQSQLRKQFLLAITALSLLFITACKEKKAEPSCVKLTKKQIEKWVKNGYTDSASSNYISSVEFHTAYAGPGKAYRVFAIGRKKDGTLIQESLVELSAVDTCKKGDHTKMNEYMFIGTVPVYLVDLEMIKDGKVREGLEYVRIDPFVYKDPGSKYDMLAYDSYAHGKDGTVLPDLPRSEGAKPDNHLPCPPCPNCKTPCPPPSSCPPGCVDYLIDSAGKTTPADSLGNK